MAATVLIVEDERTAREYLVKILQAKGYETIPAANAAEAYRQLDLGAADVVLLDMNLPDGNGLDLMDRLAQEQPTPPCIVITGQGHIDMAVEAMRKGAIDFLQKGLDYSRLYKDLERAAETVALRRELAHLRQSARGQIEWHVGQTPVMRRIAENARRAAESSTSVLLTGETGTGKDVLARAIHQMGPRRNKPFVPINCAALPEDLIESELFGHEPGAFTNATKRKPGLLETADEGILFLDEISTMPVGLQPKLLRMLDNHTFRRVGGVNEIKVDVQVLAASNRDLPVMIREGKFRDDLYYRLKVLELHLPPMRDRLEDLPALVGVFIRQGVLRIGKRVTGATPRALEALKSHPWGGNLRELRHAIDYALIFCDGPEIDLPHLPPEFGAYSPTPSHTGPPVGPRRRGGLARRPPKSARAPSAA